MLPNYRDNLNRDSHGFFCSRVGSIAKEKPIDGNAFTLLLNIACKHEASRVLFGTYGVPCCGHTYE